jgi:hypothetical protein
MPIRELGHGGIGVVYNVLLTDFGVAKALSSATATIL